MAHKEQVGRCWIVDYIGLLFLKMHRGYMKIVSSAKGQLDPLQEGMKCLNNPCDNAVVDAIKLILLIYNNFSIVKKVVNKIVRVK